MVMQSEQYSAFIAIACMIGTGLSVYSYYVETMLAEDSSYEAMCDISEQISCSKVFTSEWVSECACKKLICFVVVVVGGVPICRIRFLFPHTIYKHSRVADLFSTNPSGPQLLRLQFIIFIILCLLCVHSALSTSIYNSRNDIFFRK